eukprot:2661735-Pleurochrysis_carterae.AAC.1
MPCAATTYSARRQRSASIVERCPASCAPTRQYSLCPRILPIFTCRMPCSCGKASNFAGWRHGQQRTTSVVTFSTASSRANGTASADGNASTVLSRSNAGMLSSPYSYTST